MSAAYPPPGQPYPPGPWGPPPAQPYGPPGQPYGPPPGWPTPALAVPPTGRPGLRRLIGALLILPAFVLLIVSYVWPTGWTVWNSFRAVPAFDGQPGSFVGTRNYQAAFHNGVLGSFGYALTLALVPLLVVVLVAPVLAWAAHRAGTVARWVVRIALALPLVAYVPTALAIGNWLDRAGATNRGAPNTWSDVSAKVYLAAFGLGCAVAVTAYLAAFRRRGPNQSILPGALVAGGVLALASIALALQEFTFSYVLGGTRLGATPMIQIYRHSLVNLNLGVGAAIGTLLLIPLAVLGIGAAVLLIASRARIEVDPAYRSADESPGWTGPRVLAAVTGGVVLVVVLVLVGLSLSPWLGRIGGTVPEPVARSGGPVAHTWLPPLVSTTVGIVAAVLAAVGIGALRPLGRRSEWLLLPFAPWLFVGTGPLLVSGYVNQVRGHSGSFAALIPPTWLTIPALFLATLLMRGQAIRWQAAGRGVAGVTRAIVLPALPMLPLLFGAVWLWQAQDLLWQLIASSQESATTAVGYLEAVNLGYQAPRDVSLALAFPLGLLIPFLLVALAGQLGYLDRVAFRAGREEAVDPPPPLGWRWVPGVG